jgi:phospholipid/cholesterol/gamma-HCH transport system substrate-binding protein
MKISNEAKIGVIGLITVVVLIWGINYLKGKNILSSSIALYAYFSDANGLEPSADIFLSGFKIGLVEEIEYLANSSYPIKVKMSVEENFQIPTNSVAELFSEDLLGTKAIRIILSESSDYMKHNDTIRSRFVPDMIASLEKKLTPLLANLSTLSITLDSVGNNLNSIVGHNEIKSIIENLNNAGEELSLSLSEGGDLNKSFRNLESISSNLQDKNESIANSIENIESITESVSTLTKDSLFSNLSSLAENLNEISNQVKNGSGTLGQLIYNDSLYIYLESLSRDLDFLVLDLKENPGDYVQVSVFGKSKKK